MVIVVVVVVVVALSRGGGSPDKPGDVASQLQPEPRRTVRAKLTLEQFGQPGTSKRELLVSSPGPQVNRPEMIAGQPVVWLRCLDREGKTVIRKPHSWPLLEEPGYPLPHIHQPADKRQLSSIRRCLLTGSGIDFAGTVTGRLPLAE